MLYYHTPIYKRMTVNYNYICHYSNGNHTLYTGFMNGNTYAYSSI